MRFIAVLGILLLASSSLIYAKKKTVISPDSSAGNEQVDIVVNLSMTEAEATQELGMDPGKGIALLRVRVIPKTDAPIQINPDDFILLAHDDGERSKPFDAAEIAGSGALVLTTTTPDQGKKGPGFSLGGIVGGGASPNEPKPTTINTKMDSKSEGNAKLMDALKAKQLPSKESTEPVEGYLYFPLDGKHKLKDMAVLYRGPAGRLDIEFEH